MIKKSCGLCGARFKNVFEAVDHTRRSGKEMDFDPKFILGGKQRLNLGTLLTQIYNNSHDKAVQDIAESAFSLLYIAEMRPDISSEIFKSYQKYMDEGIEFGITDFVYLIVTQEAFREVGM